MVDHKEAKRDQIRELVGKLNEARYTYEQEDREIMSNKEYDALYDQLQALEEETGIVFADSPTINVGYEVLSDLPKEEHPSPMLSLDKTKEVARLQEWLGDKEGLLSWKLDGLTVVLTYENGELAKAVTRGNGRVGEVITANARTFVNLPVRIPFKGRLMLRGEACIKYSDFEKINSKIEDADAKYKNPRNLCSGSVRQLDSSITAKRSVNFFAFSLVSATAAEGTAGAPTASSATPAARTEAVTEEESAHGAPAGSGAATGTGTAPDDTREHQMQWLREQGFETVENVKVIAEVADSGIVEEAGADTTPGAHAAPATEAAHGAYSASGADAIPGADSAHGADSTSKTNTLPLADKAPQANAIPIAEAVQSFAGRIADNDVPSDGLVLTFNDIAYGRSLGSTAKFPRDSIAFKWQDETAETTLKEIEWNASRTGLINPVAIFEPVELEGTTVSRASVHNISIMRRLKLGIGDTITVYKANMIIPQIEENLTGSDNIQIPEACPVCGGQTQIREDNDVQVLFCINPDCQAKHIKSFAHFVERDAVNIDGLSEAILEKLIDRGLVRTYADLFRLDRYKDEIGSMEGFGEKSHANLVKAADKAAHEITAARLLYGLGVPNIGVANARMISRHCAEDWDAMTRLNKEELIDIDGIGEKMADEYVGFFADQKNLDDIAELLPFLSFAKDFEADADTEQDLAGMTFVITGSLNSFGNRKELKELIESRGGKVAGSVSSKTSFLINNDNTSQSSKNKKAQELGVKIITEEEFLNM